MQEAAKLREPATDPVVDSPGQADLFDAIAELPLVTGRRGTATWLADILAAAEDLSS